MSEKKDYQKFKDKFIRFGDRCDRIENLMLLGMPDVNFCAEGAEVWMEIKSPTEPKRETTPLFGSNHKLSQDQKNWFLRQNNAGGIGIILICTDQRWIYIDACLWADDLNEMTVSELCTQSIWWDFYPFHHGYKSDMRNKIIEKIKLMR